LQGLFWYINLTPNGKKDSFLSHILRDHGIYMNIFSPEDLQATNPFKEEKLNYNTFFKIEDQQVDTRFKKLYKIDGNLPFNFFGILKII
jgi:hypothetical protein